MSPHETTSTLTIEQIALDALQPDPANPRRIGDAELEALTKSLREFGFVQPVLARRADGVVIGGHQRLLAARRLGLSTVPVIFLELNQDQARLLNLALNKISGDWDQELLARLVSELAQVPDLDLALSGFGEDELATLLRSLDAREKRQRPESFDLDTALAEADRQTTVQPGDLVALGPHRLLCGDATRSEDVERLLGNVRPRMAFTDPPYNVALGDHGGQHAGSRKRRLANDALPPEQWAAFVRGWAEQLVGHVDGALYVCMSSKEWPTVTAALAAAGAHWSDTLIWQKDRFVLGRADYQRAYEPLWYGWPEGADRFWCGDRNQSDVWAIARPSSSPLHPTMKPLELIERALGNSSQTGDAVLDLFLGAGSTLIACERTGRICYGLELDPHYVAVAVARWQSFTGETAIKLTTAEAA